jgi:capsid protein
MQVLLPGEDVKFSSPADVGGSYEMFQYRTLLAIAAALGVPYTNVTGDLKAANYSSIRAGTVEFRRRMDQFQHATLIYQLCRPVWKRWLETAALSGALTLPGFASDPAKYAAVKWITPKWEWVDPLKDRQAEKIAQECGWKAPSDIIEAEGYDVDETYRRIAADQQRADALGIRLGKPEQQPAPTTGAASPGRRREKQTLTKRRRKPMTILPHIAGRVFDAPLLIARAKLDTILGVLMPRLRGESLPFGAKPVTRDYEITNGIAIIPIVGTLVRRTVGLEAQSGLTSYG